MWCISINLRVIYDQTVPKHHDRINSSITRHQILIKSGVKRWILRSKTFCPFFNIFCWTPQNSPFHLTLYQNVISCGETIETFMKFRYSSIINDSQIDENTSHSAINWDSYSAEWKYGQNGRPLNGVRTNGFRLNYAASNFCIRDFGFLRKSGNLKSCYKN
jgi:hypothetical protein